MITEEISRVLSDFWELGIPQYKPRAGTIAVIPQMVSTVTGVRRSGKSTRVLQYADEEIQKGNLASLRHVVWLDFDNPILAEMPARELRLIEEAVFKLNPSFNLKMPLLFIFDEIHKIAGWENYVIQLSRNQYRKVLVTGSSSKLLQKEVATELRGKSITTHLYPLSFTEFLEFHNAPAGTSTKAVAEKKRLFEQYLQWGGFPALHHTEDAHKPQLLREYFDTMMLRDLIQRYGVSKPQQCTKLLRYLFANNAKSHTLKSAYNYIKQCGLPTSQDALRDYMDYAEDAFMLDSVPIFSSSLKEQERNYKKIYAVDWGLAQYNSPVWDGYFSRSLESMVYIELRRRGLQANYYLTRSQRQEIDFIASDKSGNVESLIQVSMDITDSVTREREAQPLAAAAGYFKPREVLIITMDQESVLEIDGASIKVVPAWKWLAEGAPPPSRSLLSL